MKTVIVGGVAAGAGAAARLKRLDESMEIVLLERGKYISYANCGLPYHMGGVIPNRDSLLVMPVPKFKSWFDIDIRTENNVTAIDRTAKTVTVQKANGTTYSESYDKLILATGSSPRKLNLPGSDDPRIQPLLTIPDMDAIIALAEKEGAKRAVVIGGGFIGLEAAENLRELGLDVKIIQHSAHVLPSLDKEMAYLLAAELAEQGIEVLPNTELKGFRSEEKQIVALTADGKELPADLVIMSVGVVPNSELAKEAGLTTGKTGHIVVDDHLRTSDPDIYAAGDAVEVVNRVTGQKVAIPLAGPANKQGRIMADNIAGGDSVYRGTWGSSVIKVGKLTAGSIGLTETKLKAFDLPYQKIYAHPASNASYYPGSAQLHMKLMFAPDGKIYGAQIVGMKGVDKRLDVIGVAMQCGKTAPELAELELAYAPPFSSAKDPVNYLGMIAENVLTGKSELAQSDAIPEDAILVDVRQPEEVQAGAITGAINIPLGQIRSRLNELDKSKVIITSCQVGLRGYLAERILKSHGFKARNLSGGYLVWKYNHAPFPKPKAKSVEATSGATADLELDIRMLACPAPIVNLKKAMDKLKFGQTLRVLAAACFAPDLTAWTRSTGHELLTLEQKGDQLVATILKK